MTVDALLDRDDYPTLHEARYLNQASLGLVGTPAVDAMHRLLDDVARHGNLHLSDAEEAGFLDDLRDRASRLLCVPTRQVTVVSSASELLGQTPFLLAPDPAAEVVAVATDFPALTRPWLRLAEHGGCRLAFVEDRPDVDLTDTIVERIAPGTEVVAVGWVQYATGSVVDVPRLRAATERVGARLVLDVTQAAGVLPVDGAVWQADVLVASGYKWLGGHGGVAIGALTDELASRTPPLPGWFGADDPFDFDATRLDLAADARRFTASTMSYLSVVGLSTAIDGLLRVGIDEVAAHATRLADRLADALAPTGWRPFRPHRDTGASPHIVSLVPPDGTSTDAALVAARLRDDGIVCGERGGRLRVSLAAYNDASDVDALAGALA